MRFSSMLLIGMASSALAACGAETDPVSEPDPSTEANLEQKAEELDAAATRAADETQEDVLEDQANALREAADGEAVADDEGSVTVVKE